MGSTTEGLRRQQLEGTRQRIVAATVEVMARDGAAALSFPAVAEEAGVSLRTVYRHFPNKEALLQAAVQVGSDVAGDRYPEHFGGDELRRFLPRFWAEIESQRDLLAVQLATPSGVAARQQRIRARREDLRRRLRRELPGVPAPDRARLADLLTVLIGSSLLFDLVDHLEVDLDDAAALAAYAIESVVERARTEGSVR